MGVSRRSGPGIYDVGRQNCKYQPALDGFSVMKGLCTQFHLQTSCTCIVPRLLLAVGLETLRQQPQGHRCPRGTGLGIALPSDSVLAST